MIWAGAGGSLEEDAEQAAREASRQAMDQAGTDRADLAIVFATVTHRPEYPLLLRTVREETRAASVIGCSAMGVVSPHGEIEGGTAISVVAIRSDQFTTRTFLHRQLQRQPAVIGQSIARMARGLPEAPDRLMIALPDTLHFDPGPFFAGLNSEGGNFPVVGGGASEDGSATRTFVFCNEEAVSDAIGGALLSGRFRCGVVLSQACRPVAEPMLITKARGRTIYELGGRPACSVLIETAQTLPFDNLQTALGNLLIGIPIDPGGVRLEPGRYIVRNLVGADPERGTIQVPEELEVGRAVSLTIREPEGSREDLSQALAEQLAGWDHPPRVGLYFNCCGRGLALYDEPDVDFRQIRQALPETPIAGFFTYAELAPVRGTNLLHNYSGVLLLIG